MASVATYINCPGNTEEAFEHYRKVFGTDYAAPIQRFGDMASPADRDKVLHVALPLFGGHLLMGTDSLESMGHQQRIGNNTTIQLQPDSRADADRLYTMLAEGGTDTTGMQDMPWGAYWGCCLDRFGIRWMINFPTAGA
jgi:PhnB protein